MNDLEHDMGDNSDEIIQKIEQVKKAIIAKIEQPSNDALEKLKKKVASLKKKMKHTHHW